MKNVKPKSYTFIRGDHYWTAVSNLSAASRLAHTGLFSHEEIRIYRDLIIASMGVPTEFINYEQALSSIAQPSPRFVRSRR